jgi:group I intron endonuclease
MPEQLDYKIYKITNSMDSKIYIGSTRIGLGNRMSVHRNDARRGCKKPLSIHMIKNGISNFKIVLIEDCTVSSKKEARKLEQLEIDKHDKSILLNTIRAYSANHDQTRNITKKRKNRRDFYDRKKKDPVWLKKERDRNRIRMQLKRSKNVKDTVSETEQVCAKITA